MKLATFPLGAKLDESRDPTAGALRPETEESAIPSVRLLQGRSSIAIEHRGTQYFLRATRAGKLILTK
ncbi:MAG TPA: hemin uptake protein HemP [Aromatoleum sp.]|uniref:hemin uptake protein HemP n=1 Tax=Aromatoleum sp. TaxID=2307007 RepID=UPI002B488DFA|nr:hemin uptake protein HemP [Aromatoleum sp.]HJV24924.1 hemin uptake protein HemP [Aromatoleum sp.]